MIEQGYGRTRESAHGGRRAGRSAGVAILVATLGFIAGCTTGGGLTNASPEARRAAVAERVNARWAALIKGDLDAAYLFLSPATREVVSLQEFSSRSRGSGFQKVEVDSVECEPEVCKVQLYLTYDHRLMKGIRTPVSESWVISQGQAWYVWQR